MVYAARLMATILYKAHLQNAAQSLDRTSNRFTTMLSMTAGAKFSKKHITATITQRIMMCVVASQMEE